MTKLQRPAAAGRHDDWVQAAGRRLALRWIVPNEVQNDAILVFLHEGLGSIDMWKDFPDLLCETLGLQGVVYDRWGYGGSEPLDRPRTVRYLHDEAVLFLPAVLEACGIERPILFGHSDGGTIALLYAATFPKEPRAVVCEAAHVFVEELTLHGIRAAVEAWKGTDLSSRLERYHGPKARELFFAWADTWLSPAFRHWNIEDELGAIEAPLLVIQGLEDEYGTPAQVSAIERGTGGPSFPCLIPRCGHVPHHQARPDVLRVVKRFLDLILQTPT